VVDTDAHVTGELATHADVSQDSAIDTLRVEVLDDRNSEVDSFTLVVADPNVWPLSFGIAASPSFGSEVRVRLRAFQALFAASGTTANGAATLDPAAEVTIDRLIAVPVPTSGVQTVRVTLQTDCMGTASGFGSPLKSCLDAGHLAGDPHAGLDTSGDALPSSVGTWAQALAVPCRATPKDRQICIPGGFFILGDLYAVGAQQLLEAFEPVPLHPVLVSPFHLDEYEYTVGDFRALVAAGTFTADTGTMPTFATPSDPFNQFCAWLGPDDASHDSFPLNCVPYATAQTLCALAGGSLPTEAQWEYAARGRGQRRLYPWGAGEPGCCSASLNRLGAPPAFPMMCSGMGLEPVGSHPLSSSCSAVASGQSSPTGDMTRDGVYDMAGSVSEALADSADPFTSPCWTTAAILHDPSCNDPAAPFGERGSNWNAGTGTALLALRNDYSGAGSPTSGFRCAYADAP
jgi:formylglycine-generating enzyme required for sulfatase activity